jgi:hypothetical protein
MASDHAEPKQRGPSLTVIVMAQKIERARIRREVEELKVQTQKTIAESQDLLDQLEQVLSRR